MSLSVNHRYIQSTLNAALMTFKQYSVFSELSIEIEGKEYVPDLCVYTKHPFNPSRDMIRMKEIPLLAIEILSPTQIIQELIDKIEIYLNAGVQSCWLVVPAFCTIAVYHDLEKPINFGQDKVIDEKLNIRIPLEDIFLITTSSSFSE